MNLIDARNIMYKAYKKANKYCFAVEMAQGTSNPTVADIKLMQAMVLKSLDEAGLDELYDQTKATVEQIIEENS